ncbi:interleukin-20 receptor subunit alpha [Sinocyclocheilus rhinocerous]|uniref:Interleukin-20 receptor subunit alpha-like n=1 Tax=Sinocyclocheilus rhinocerous TaxID=307959 RepID=A0A673KB65_9TELE|nr:PREDICTED: interleukin-20 receptor subunit alpha-like [Sinocyclocheilus rhinocerous]
MDPVSLIALCLLWTGTSASFVEGPPEPRNVHFYSENLRNIVRWTPGEGSPYNTVYTVEYAIYGDEEENGTEQVRWRRVEHCTSVTQNECDVSQETFNLEDDYYARVRAVSANTQSVWNESMHRFSPEFDTVLGAPLLELTVLQNYIDVTIKGPFRWRTKRTKKDKSLWKIFPHMIYNVSVINSRSSHTNYMRLKNGNLTLGPLDFSTQLCVVVQAQSESRPLAYKPSDRLCVETAKDPFREQLLAAMLGGVLPSALCLCVLAVLGGLVHCYITDHRQRLPKSTHVVGTSEKLHTFQPQMPATVIFNVIKLGDKSAALPQLLCGEDSSAADEAARAVSADPPGCYAQQHAALADPQDTDSVHSEPQHSEDGDYGIVLPAAFEAPYRTQGHTIHAVDAREDEPDDEEQAQIFLDWSPGTGELKIPLMGLLGLEDEAQLQTEAVTLLPNIILRQSSGDSCEPEPDHFITMERDWGLVIHSSPD